MLRGTIGITVAVQAWLFITSQQTDLLEALPAAVLIAGAIALTVGIFTPVSTSIVALGYALGLFTPLGGEMLPRLDCAAAVIGLAAATALGFLGPGAFSIDARLFGRRAIFIPANDASEQP